MVNIFWRFWASCSVFYHINHNFRRLLALLRRSCSDVFRLWRGRRFRRVWSCPGPLFLAKSMDFILVSFRFSFLKIIIDFTRFRLRCFYIIEKVDRRPCVFEFLFTRTARDRCRDRSWVLGVWSRCASNFEPLRLGFFVRPRMLLKEFRAYRYLMPACELRCGSLGMGWVTSRHDAVPLFSL
jgi:hypothetical protein